MHEDLDGLRIRSQDNKLGVSPIEGFGHYKSNQNQEIWCMYLRWHPCEAAYSERPVEQGLGWRWTWQYQPRERL